MTPTAAPARRAELEDALFHYLMAVCRGQPRARQPLVAGRDTLAAMVGQPHPDLMHALHHCIDQLAVEMMSDPGSWGTIAAPAESLLVALAAYNCLAMPANQDADDPSIRDATAFNAALIASLPPARDLPTALAYHAVLRGVEQILPNLTEVPFHQLAGLTERSPLTALWLLDWFMPAALDELTSELLVGWRRAGQREVSVWANLPAWTAVVASLLSEPAVARWVHQRWLSMPETRAACRNQGLVLEALRRHTGQRHFILSFYEAYEHFTWRAHPRGGGLGSSPGLDMAEALLTTPGHSEAAIRANRWGNEVFLKFHAYIEIIEQEGRIPTDYNLLTLDFVREALLLLTPYLTRPGSQASATFGEITFASQEAGRSGHDG